MSAPFENTKGKAPIPDLSDARGSDQNGPAATGFRPHQNMKVEPPRQEDLQRSYAAIVDDAHYPGWYGAMVNAIGSVIGTLGAIPCCICCPNPYKRVQQGHVGLVTKFGRFYKAVDPGLVKINPLSESLIQVDVKIQIVEVPLQTCITKDNVSLQINSVIYYSVVSPHKAAFGVSNVRQALVERTQTTLRHVVGARVLQDVIERREEVAQSIGEIIEDVASHWGVQVESMLIKDMIFSQELQESLSMAAQSKRIGESKIIAAKAEVSCLLSPPFHCYIIILTLLPSSRSKPPNSCARPPTSSPRRRPCRSATSRPCKPWPRAPTPRSSSCRPPTRPCPATPPSRPPSSRRPPAPAAPTPSARATAALMTFPPPITVSTRPSRLR
jgi:erythrocyte band 7 integral membrane protein